MTPLEKSMHGKLLTLTSFPHKKTTTNKHKNKKTVVVMLFLCAEPAGAGR